MSLSHIDGPRAIGWEKDIVLVTVGRDEIGQRSETVRRANLSAILRELHLRGPMSRSDLVARTGLTRSAIRGLIHELVAGGFLTEDRPVLLGTPGRPSPLVRTEARNATVLALEISVDSLAAAVVGLGGEVLGVTRIERPRDHGSPDDIVADLVTLARSAREAAGDVGDPVGIAATVVGIVRSADGHVSMAPNLGWRDVPLGDHLADAFGTEVLIRVGNDADLGALAESRRGAAVGIANVLYLAGEVGVGGGVIADGLPLTGATGYSGEVGHIPLDPDGSPCRCGSTGCWETLVGEGRLLALAGYPADGGTAAVDALLRDARDGEPRALDALATVGRWLGFGLAGLVNVLSPELIVLGARFERLYPFIAGHVEAQLDRYALPGSRALVRVVPATLGEDAALLGAAELALEPLVADPAAWLGPRDALTELRSA
jgi:predicted NBD/HSP70 family sugar kinase